ncbi:MAG TPA: response regulator transcription factor [Acidimicrobiales bacterium]
MTLGGEQMDGGARILVVDEDVDERESLVHALAARGYLASPTDPADAPAVARSFRPDLVVLEMAGGGGLIGATLARCLREQGDPLLVFLTREDRTSSRLAAFDAGADDYVTKPFVVEELLARIRAALRRSGRLGHAVSHVGPLVVDERTRVVEFDGSPIDIGPTDFRLLAVLARHAGQVMTNADLLAQVWGHEPHDESLVTARISLLRTRLGPDAAGLLHTVRGVGYVLRDDDATGVP